MSGADNPYLRKSGDQLVPTVLGLNKLEEIVTDVQGPVYAFKHTFSPVIVSAAMARLSRRMGDLRTTILDEFILAEKADALLQRVITGYGDDSVQQLTGVHLVVEGASNLLTKFLEWGRLAAYLEQSTRYIYFDQKDERGQYRYFVPRGLSAGLSEAYRLTMDKTFDRYSSMVHELTAYLRKKNPEPSEQKERTAWLNATRAAACDAIRPVLPAATKSTVGIFASAQSVDRMIMNLLSEELIEARVAGQRLLREARKVIPTFLERTDLPERGGAAVAYRADTRATVKELANKYLKPTQSSLLATGQPRLVSWWPDNELDLVSEILYDHSSMPLQQIEKQVQSMPKDRKVEIFRAYIGERRNRRHRPGRAFEKAHFEWEIDGGDYGTFRDLQRHRMVDSWEWQKITPWLGYSIPDLVSEAGLEEEFIDCFRWSEGLYRKLAGEVGETEAQYAVLMGHQMRYRFLMNLRESFHFLELRTGPAGHPGYRRLCGQMFMLLKGVYPLSAQGMKFVNQADVQLGRLEAERASQYKLEKLDSLGV